MVVIVALIALFSVYALFGPLRQFILRNQQVDVYSVHSYEPAPIGIVDYGIGPGGAYKYSTNEFLGLVNLQDILTTSEVATNWMSIQLNTNFLINLTDGEQRTYLVQNFLDLNTNSFTIFFGNNIWNISTYVGFQVGGSSLHGGGNIYSTGAPNNESFYGFTTQDSKILLPAKLLLDVISQVDAVGQLQIDFRYSTSPTQEWVTYDVVTFVVPLGSTGAFVVNGFKYSSHGTYFDSELVLCGYANQDNPVDVHSNVGLTLEFNNGHNLQAVTNAYNFGSNTLEGISGAAAIGGSLQDNAFPQSIVSNSSSSNGSLGVLYYSSDVCILEIRSASMNTGTLLVEKVNQVPSENNGQSGVPFVNGEVIVTLSAGQYDLKLLSPDGTLYGERAVTLSAGENLSMNAPFT